MRYLAKEQERKHLKALKRCEGSGRRYSFLVGYNPEQDRLYKLYSPHSPGFMKWVRRKSNRRVRHSSVPLKGCGYKKEFNLWYWVD